jgi:hypothetical protein
LHIAPWSGVCMLALRERLEFRRRYSRARDHFASRFSHLRVLEYFCENPDPRATDVKRTSCVAVALNQLRTQNAGLSRAWLSPVSRSDTAELKEVRWWAGLMTPQRTNMVNFRLLQSTRAICWVVGEQDRASDLYIPGAYGNPDHGLAMIVFTYRRPRESEDP